MHENLYSDCCMVGSNLAFINDTRKPEILNYCIEAKVYGIICFMGMTLREGNRILPKLDQHFPGLKEKYHGKIRIQL